MSPEPLVTVVIATWNWSQALRLSLRSALAQTERRIEVLVVADGCTDDTAQAVRAAADPRARLIELPVRTGSQAAPNDRGIAEARAPWIAYLGHDDLWHPRHLETLVRVAEREAADVAHAVGLVYGPPGTGQRSVSGITRSGRPERDAFFPPTTLLHRRDLTARVGPWPVPAETALPIDVDLQRRAWDAGLRFVPSGRATAFKFPAAHRRDAYRRRDVAEQAALLARLEQDADGTLAEEARRPRRGARAERGRPDPGRDGCRARPPPPSQPRPQGRGGGGSRRRPAAGRARRRRGLLRRPRGVVRARARRRRSRLPLERPRPHRARRGSSSMRPDRLSSRACSCTRSRRISGPEPVSSSRASPCPPSAALLGTARARSCARSSRARRRAAAASTPSASASRCRAPWSWRTSRPARPTPVAWASASPGSGRGPRRSPQPASIRRSTICRMPPWRR